MGRFTLTMFAALGDLEVEIIKERGPAGMDYARKHGTKSGRAIGRPRKVFNRDAVHQLAAQGLSTPQIGDQLGLSRSTASRTLERAA